MPLTSEQREKLISEMKQFSSALNLSETQKQKMQEFLSHAYEKTQLYIQQNPKATKDDLLQTVADNRGVIRQHLTSLLTAEQLTKWDAEVDKIKDFLIVKAVAAAASVRNK